MKYISNAFSLQMVPRHLLASVQFTPCDPPGNDAISIVGHADTARILGVEFNRQSVMLQPGDELFVAQLVGGRLPEGATTLPEGARFEWVMVTLSQSDLDKMWAEFVRYQPYADRHGFGAEWRQMCEERTTEAAFAALLAATMDEPTEATEWASSAVETAGRAVVTADARWMQHAIDTLYKAFANEEPL